MSQFNFEEAARSIQDDDYTQFKEAYNRGLEVDEVHALLRLAVVHSRKFTCEYILKNTEIDPAFLNDCQAIAATQEDLSAFQLMSNNGIADQTWLNLFNVQPISVIQPIIEKNEVPEEHALLIIQYALANQDPEVHKLAFEKIFKSELIADEQEKRNLLDSIAFSGNLELFDYVEGAAEIKAFLEEKQKKHAEFAELLDEYIGFIFDNTPKEKVASTVNHLQLMEEIKKNPNVEDWDLIIQDYLVNEETDLVGKAENVPSENVKKMLELLRVNDLRLLEISEVLPQQYKIKGKDVISGGDIEVVLDRRIYDPRCIYLCYVLNFEQASYICSHPLLILPDRKSLIQLGLRKEKDRKQQQAGKKSKLKKKPAKKVSLTTSEKFKYLLGEHIRSRKEIDDSV